MIGADNPLEKFVTLGRVNDEVDVFGDKIRMKVLNSGQRKEVLAESGHLDAVTRAYQIQLSTLARAIISINNRLIQYVPESKDEPITEEKRIEQSKRVLEKIPQPVIDYLYERYGELLKKQESIIDELKKKYKKAGPGQSGKSESKSDSEGSST